jgi:serine phosphatase RsbU (regulator of sigma subunit)
MLSANILAVVAGAPLFAARPWAQWMAGLLSRPLHWPFPISTFGVLGDLEMFSVLAILILGYARSRRDEERLESELEAARAVQKVLIPDEVPGIPGFQVQTVYRPASQVGGDFFQIIPLEAGGALIAVGDVSGKGMPAAMTVSLLVGTFRTLAHYTQSPAEILRAMNQRMLARSQGGFTTCLVMRLDGDGTLTMANAGHIAPYVDGRETTVVNGLPLGLAAEGGYSETAVRLTANQALTVLTDGVVEARNARGELFGFDRTAAISAEPAEEIARQAQQFGQEDDITVLSLKRGGGDGGAGPSALLADPV